MTKNSITLYIVKNAQIDEAGDNHVQFARAVTSLEKEATLIVTEQKS